MMIEPSSAVSMAVLLHNKDLRPMMAKQKFDWNIGIVLTGGNISARRIIEELGTYWFRNGSRK